MGIDDYTLGRDYKASARLHVQHHLWTETFGYLMNPSVPNSSDGLSIAEVGTGTGIWLFEVGRRLASPPSDLCGIDISGDQFPRAEWLPPNARFVAADALDPAGPPEELVGAFDIVHMRLFIAIIKDNDPSDLLNFCNKLLKPGGYLQWDDHDPSVNRVGSYEGSPAEGMGMVSTMTQTHKPTEWIPKLPEHYEKHGFRVVTVDRQVILPWQRGMYADNYCMLADEFVERAEQGGPGIRPVDGFYKELSAKASKEKQLGSYMEQTLQIVVGMKV
ncbi:MAG: hypothetical protein MMC23_003125 [Stictis urceolatum]|nr:hypothetical protein [Stictis urceolata]